VFSSDLPGVIPATLNEMILYYRLMTKWSGLGDSTELSQTRLSQAVAGWLVVGADARWWWWCLWRQWGIVFFIGLKKFCCASTVVHDSV
jgi:hypothetical protein